MLDKIKTYFIDIRSELRKVIWPDRKETTQYLYIVLGSVTAMAIFLWIIDSVFNILFKLLIS